MIGLRKLESSAVLGLLWLAACGGGPSSSVDAPQASLTLTLSDTGVSPKDSSILGNGAVTIVNDDGFPHQIASNPSPEQIDCPELNSPPLAPGDQFIANIANRDGTCGFIDSLNPTDSKFQGTITVTTFNPTPDSSAAEPAVAGY